MRLKGGDPFVFGRGGEEAEALAAAGIPFEVVPGITSAIGAAAYAGIPVTHRGVSTHFTVVTGHEDPTKDRTDVDWEALARAGGTLVILMGAGRIADDRPAPRSRVGARPTRRSPRSATAPGPTSARCGPRWPPSPTPACARRARSSSVTSPASTSSWFEARPLFGRSVVVTRAREQASELRPGFEELGAEVLELPAIEITPVDFTVPDLARYDWLVFTSANGVRAFFDRGLDPAGLDARALAGVRVAAIGPGTAARAGRRGASAPTWSPSASSPSRSSTRSPRRRRPGARVLLARAEQARDVLPDGLAERGYAVDVLAGLPHGAGHARSDAASRGSAPATVDAITFTSSSTVDNFCAALGPRPDPQPTRRLDRAGHVGDRRRARPPRRRRSRPSTPSTASSPPSSRFWRRSA